MAGTATAEPAAHESWNPQPDSSYQATTAAEAIAENTAAKQTTLAAGSNKRTFTAASVDAPLMLQPTGTSDVQAAQYRACAAFSKYAYEHPAGGDEYVRPGEIYTPQYERPYARTHVDDMVIAYTPLGSEDMIIAIRGTATMYDVANDIALFAGYQSLFNTEKAAVLATVNSILSITGIQNFILTGHSLGGMLAQSVALDIISQGVYAHRMQHCITFNPYILLTDKMKQFLDGDDFDSYNTMFQAFCMQNDFSSMIPQTIEDASLIGYVHVYGTDAEPVTVLPSSWATFKQLQVHTIDNFVPATGGITPLTDYGPTPGDSLHIDLIKKGALTQYFTDATVSTLSLYADGNGATINSKQVMHDEDAVGTGEHGSYIFNVGALLLGSEGVQFDATTNQISIPRTITSNYALFAAEQWVFKRVEARSATQAPLMDASLTNYFYIKQFFQATGQTTDFVVDTGIFNQALPQNLSTGTVLGNEWATWQIHASTVQPFHDGLRRALLVLPPPTFIPTEAPSPPPSPPTPIPTPPPSPPTPPANPWHSNQDNIQYHMWEQNMQSAGETRGYCGYVRIKSKYLSDLYNKDVLALNENTSNANGYLTYAPKWANSVINWDDNNAQPDEHIWKIQYFGDDAEGEPLFNLTNTMSGFPFASWYINNGTAGYLSATLASVKIDYHRHIATGNNAPVERTYYVISTHFEGPGTLGNIFARQTQYNIDHHYGSAMITTGDTTLDTDDRMREWIFEFI